jgi:hypothetical protein
MSPTIISALVGTSGLIGLLALVAYFFYSHQVHRLEQSIRRTIEGEAAGLFNPEKVVDLLRTFDTPESRLAALKELIGLDDRAARRVYAKIEGSVNLQKWTDQDPKKRARASLQIASFSLFIALIAYSAIAPKPIAQILATPTPSFNPYRSPAPVLSLEQVQALWNVVILRVMHSKLVESYVPDQVHAADLMGAIRDNEDVENLIADFKSKAQLPVSIDDTLKEIDDTLKKIQEDLYEVGASQFPHRLNPYALQTAEYHRVELLDLLTDVSLQLNCPRRFFQHPAQRQRQHPARWLVDLLCPLSSLLKPQILLNCQSFPRRNASL